MEVRIKPALLWLAVALVGFGVLMRLLPHPDNLAPVGAIALFGGAVLPRKLAWWLPLAVMMVSDAVIGTYDGIVFTWIAFFLVGLFGMSLRDKSNWLRLPVGVVGSSVIFFVVSNFGVWAQAACMRTPGLVWRSAMKWRCPSSAIHFWVMRCTPRCSLAHLPSPGSWPAGAPRLLGRSDRNAAATRHAFEP